MLGEMGGKKDDVFCYRAGRPLGGGDEAQFHRDLPGFAWVLGKSNDGVKITRTNEKERTKPRMDK